MIKNKTLQFLARALPVLKLEYETIPKVARYLPGASPHLLLNPTHSSSSLSQDDMELVNQHLGYSMVPNALRRRRRRRRDTQDSRASSQRQVNETAPVQVNLNGVITKDGYKPIGLAGLSGKGTQRHPGYVHSWVPGMMQASGSLSVQPARSQPAANLNGAEETNNKPKQQSSPSAQLSAKQSSLAAGNNVSSNDRQNGSASLSSSPASQADKNPQQVANITTATGAHAIDAAELDSRQSAKEKPVEARRRLGCADSASGFTSA